MKLFIFENGCAWQTKIWTNFAYSQGQLKRTIVRNFFQMYDQVKYIWNSQNQVSFYFTGKNKGLHKDNII